MAPDISFNIQYMYCFLHITNMWHYLLAKETFKSFKLRQTIKHMAIKTNYLHKHKIQQIRKKKHFLLSIFHGRLKQNLCFWRFLRLLSTNFHFHTVHSILLALTLFYLFFYWFNGDLAHWLIFIRRRNNLFVSQMLVLTKKNLTMFHLCHRF